MAKQGKKDWKTAPAKECAKEVVKVLKKHYDPVCALHFENPFQLLIATILSAQCTDERVNQVTPGLFQKFPNAHAFAQADQNELEAIIRSTGFYRNKAKSILAVSQALADPYNGEVPQEMEALTSLPGIGRKTANVVLGTAFGHPAIMVDTHVKRVANRLELTHEKNPEKIEQDLVKLIPEKERTDFSHRLIWHGRKVCAARNPQCEGCMIAKYCPSEGVV